MQDQTIDSSYSIAFVVFIKTPGLSPVKTRLAKGLNKSLAEEFYRLSVSAVAEIGEELRIKAKPHKLDVLWAVAEEEGLSLAPGKEEHRLFQGRGTLGERLANIYELVSPKYDLILFVGGDCPQMQSSAILAGIDHLQKKPCFVIGPAQDGGFWLWGGSAKVDKGIWTQVSYSCDTTYHEMRERLELNAECIDLVSYTDVDHAEDLKQLNDFFAKQEAMLPAQKTLMAWLNKNA